MFKIGECEQEWSLEFSDFAYFCFSLYSFIFLGETFTNVLTSAAYGVALTEPRLFFSL